MPLERNKKNWTGTKCISNKKNLSLKRNVFLISDVLYLVLFTPFHIMCVDVYTN